MYLSYSMTSFFVLYPVNKNKNDFMYLLGEKIKIKTSIEIEIFLSNKNNDL